jgi:hypothetical protein
MIRVLLHRAALAATLAVLAALAAGQTVIGMSMDALQDFLDRHGIRHTQEGAGQGQRPRLTATYTVEFRGVLCNGTTVINPDYRASCDCRLTYLSDDGQRVTHILRDVRPSCPPPPARLLGED